MPEFTAACLQMCSSRAPDENAETFERLVREAAAKGAHYIQSPEMTGLVEKSKTALWNSVKTEDEDPLIARAIVLARELSVWIHIGSLALKTPDERIINQAIVVSPKGEIVARYAKIHMFDVDLPNGESWRESAIYTPGDKAVAVDLPWIRAGLAICYDLRFPHLFRQYAQAGVGLLTVPAAFTKQTGEAHWHTLLRARAIENGCYVVAAAQGGVHQDGRETYGHSLIIDPWGRILCDTKNDEAGVVLAKINPQEVSAVRGRVPSLKNERQYAEVTAASAQGLRSVS